MTVDIRLLKHFALERLPSHSALRYVLLVEPERLSVEEFIGRIPVWLALLDHELEPNSTGTHNSARFRASRVPRDSKPLTSIATNWGISACPHD